MRSILVPALLAALPAAAAAAADIGHDAITCAVADRHPRLEARLTPADQIARARVSFRPGNGSHWYSVPMTLKDGVYAGILPRPRKNLERFQYAIEVTDHALQVTRSPEQSVSVAAGPAACQDQKVATSLATAAVTLEAPAGASALPSGFSGAGVTGTTAAAGVAAGAAVAAGAGAAAAGGGGASAALLIGGGVVAAGAAVAAVTVSGGGDGDDAPVLHFTQLSVQFVPSPPGIDMSPCRSGLSWGGQSVVAEDGAFDETWAPMDPNTARVVGTVTSTSFTATLSCVSGSTSGSLNATGGPDRYQGEWVFGGKRGGLVVEVRDRR